MKYENDPALALLVRKLEEAKIRNPHWSLRAFGQRLGISSGALSEILRGKRPISLQTRRRMVERLQLSPLEQKQILVDGIADNRSGSATDYHELDSDAFHMISDWWHFAILNLVKTVGFKPEVPWLSKRLGLPSPTVKEAWQRLLRLGYLQKSGEKFVRRHPKLKTSSDVLDLSIQRAHIEDARLVEKAILDVPLSEREVTSITFALKSDVLPKAKEYIRKFQDEFCESIESEQGHDVYRLSIALIPLTARSKGKK